MSALLPPPTTPGALLCPRCGNALRDDQAWCLECGLAARTRIHPPPGWRGPIVATLLALALLAAGISLALVALLDEPEPTPAPTTVTVPATTPAPDPSATPGAAEPLTPTTGSEQPDDPTAETPSGGAGALDAPSVTDTPPGVGGGGSAGRDAPGVNSGGSRLSRPSRGRSGARTFRIPGTGIELPATGERGGR